MSEYQRYNTRSAKLTVGEVQEIRQLYHEEGWSQGRLARKFNMSVVQIGRIVRGESQRKVPELVDTSAADINPNALPVHPDEIASSMARLSEKLGAKPFEPPTPVEPPTNTDHAAGIAALAKQARERRGLDNAAEAAREETRDDSKDTNEVQTARPAEANPTDAASGVRDRVAGSSAGEGGAAAASTVPAGPARGAGSDEG